MTDGTPPDSFEALLHVLDELGVPDGYKAEIIEGNIVVSPWPKGYYADVMELVCDQLRPHLPAEHRLGYGPLLYVFPGSEGAFGPSIHAAHRRTYRTTSNRLNGEGLCFVTELTSTASQVDDPPEKVKVYGKSGVPVCLLLDMQEEQATVYWSPYTRGYQARFTKPFGEKLHIPAPFDCELKTAGFQAPAES